MSVDPWKPWPPPPATPAEEVRRQLLVELEVEQYARPGSIPPAPYRHQDCDITPCIDCREETL